MVASRAKSPAFVHKFINELWSATFFRENASEDQKMSAINAFLTFAADLKTKDMVEAQLIAQMMTAHTTAMECAGQTCQTKPLWVVTWH